MRHRLVEKSNCRTCPVGKQHARGKTVATWQDGEPIEKLYAIRRGMPPGEEWYRAHRRGVPSFEGEESGVYDVTHDGD